MEKKILLKPFLIKMECEVCNDGEMEIIASEEVEIVTLIHKTNDYPKKHYHRCNACGVTKQYHTKYPYIKHVTEGDANEEVICG
jgi:hypothetical protein